MYSLFTNSKLKTVFLENYELISIFQHPIQLFQPLKNVFSKVFFVIWRFQKKLFDGNEQELKLSLVNIDKQNYLLSKTTGYSPSVNVSISVSHLQSISLQQSFFHDKQNFINGVNEKVYFELNSLKNQT